MSIERREVDTDRLGDPHATAILSRRQGLRDEDGEYHRQRGSHAPHCRVRMSYEERRHNGSRTGTSGEAKMNDEKQKSQNLKTSKTIHETKRGRFYELIEQSGTESDADDKKDRLQDLDSSRIPTS
ncbi:hypothetical protein RRF57_000916 [Xylaria bambusicola]|uniref:Uncharacterized protein n=1 Tax=Xylaria bambusicola TaxID=326684 RepID=A0AAN7UFF4_9PEZI